ncbi:hypothetical protein PILCRDRAFT_820284 [Piloderma croceum F 1598]|uniref:Uncharacterized protein n=1 Tax=Piloderma croceum (strain F 1598) TaxID=765440 RepID=A0A0C3B806_PILCF|nr:hypothetical protein PILCRDRAFT_820284 [Piloderma croceum F 1598]
MTIGHDSILLGPPANFTIFHFGDRHFEQGDSIGKMLVDILKAALSDIFEIRRRTVIRYWIVPVFTSMHNPNFDIRFLSVLQDQFL